MNMLKVRTISLAILLSLVATTMVAQDHRFNPMKFKADLESFITVQACLTPAEAAKFFPLYDEMNNKQRPLYGKIMELKMMKPADEEACRKAIAEIDRLELEIKQIQANYHARFLTVIPASKLYDVIKAEGRFHRQAMKNAARPRPRPPFPPRHR